VILKKAQQVFPKNAKMKLSKKHFPEYFLPEKKSAWLGLDGKSQGQENVFRKSALG